MTDFNSITYEEVFNVTTHHIEREGGEYVTYMIPATERFGRETMLLAKLFNKSTKVVFADMCERLGYDIKDANISLNDKILNNNNNRKNRHDHDKDTLERNS